MSFEEYKNKILGKDGQIHYVYWVTDKEDKTHYIGKHRCSKNINIVLEFWRYGTSSFKRPLLLKFGEERFVFTILREFDNAAESSFYEAYLHTKFKVASNPHFWNRVEVGLPTGLKYAQTDRKVPVIIIATGERTAVTSKEYKENRDKYKHLATGSLNCFDTFLNKSVKISREEYYKNKDRYIHHQRGRIPRYDFFEGRNRQVLMEDVEADPERYGPMEHENREKLFVYDLNNKIIKVDREEYHKNKDKYRTPSTGFVNAIIKETGEFKTITKEEFFVLKNKGEAVGFAHFSKNDKVLDLVEKKIKQISKEERAANPERYKYINSREAKDFLGRKHEKPHSWYSVYDKTTKDFKKISKEEYHLNREKYFHSSGPEYRQLLKELKTKKED